MLFQIAYLSAWDGPVNEVFPRIQKISLLSVENPTPCKVATTVLEVMVSFLR
jgi:hypothetical protein